MTLVYKISRPIIAQLIYKIDSMYVKGTYFILVAGCMVRAGSSRLEHPV